jgi:hypothetical protein
MHNHTVLASALETGVWWRHIWQLYAREGPQFPLQGGGWAPGSIWMGFIEDKFPFLHRGSNSDYPASGFTDQGMPTLCSNLISIPKRRHNLGSKSEHCTFRLWETCDVDSPFVPSSDRLSKNESFSPTHLQCYSCSFLLLLTSYS